MVTAGLRICLSAVAVAMLLTSCDATIHFYPEAEGAGRHPVRLDVDWGGFGKNVPTGMTVVCHHAETGEKVRVIDNNITSVTPWLSPGRHWATVFNLTEDEFSSIGFRGLESVGTAEAYVRESSRSKWYVSRAGGAGYVAGEPEWLAVDTIMTDAVDPSAVEETLIGTLHPQNIIHTLHVTVHTGNIGNLRSARAAITGLADGRRLASDSPNDNTVTVTHLMEADSWTRSRTSSDPDIGMARADIRCFGLPGNHLGTEGENILEFQAMLGDGKTVLRYEMPVGHLIDGRKCPPGHRGDNLDLYLDIWLDPPLPPGESGDDWGFSADVEDWEDPEDVPVPF